jgi:hypothetical protein
MTRIAQNCDSAFTSRWCCRPHPVFSAAPAAVGLRSLAHTRWRHCTIVCSMRIVLPGNDLRALAVAEADARQLGSARQQPLHLTAIAALLVVQARCAARTRHHAVHLASERGGRHAATTSGTTSQRNSFAIASYARTTSAMNSSAALSSARHCRRSSLHAGPSVSRASARRECLQHIVGWQANAKRQIVNQLAKRARTHRSWHRRQQRLGASHITHIAVETSRHEPHHNWKPRQSLQVFRNCVLRVVGRWRQSSPAVAPRRRTRSRPRYAGAHHRRQIAPETTIAPQTSRSQRTTSSGG